MARPNPVKAGETVTLNIKGNYESCDIALFSTHGQLAKSATTTNGTFDTTGLTPGHYIYKLASNGREVGTGKLIVK